ncbi:flavodoxin family protein [Methanofollis fontis]|nr:flavodoxin family protein [Methanofollis fontis]
MKVVGFVGSPRKGGNTDILVGHALKGAVDAGAKRTVVHLNDLAFRDCQGCGYCKKAGECRLNDGMDDIYPLVQECDGIILGTPIYFGMPTGTAKSFIDRWYAFLNADFSSRILPGKKAALILPQGDANPDVYAPMAAHLSATMEFFGLRVAAPLIVPGLLEPGEVEDDSAMMDRAYALGRWLVSE